MHTRSPRPRRLRDALVSVLAWTLALHPVLPGVALAGPEGAQVVHGDVQFDAAGDVTTIHASDGSIIDYTSFDIHGHETVEFIQPGDWARVLNRIQSATPTRIDGALLANGQVYIVNPAGVYFGDGAVVDVARLVAAAGHITDEDFLSGLDHFTGVEGAVENLGAIDASAVQLVGRHVVNAGDIRADGGLVVLAAGSDVLIGEREGHVYLKLEGVLADAGEAPGVANTGRIEAGDGEVSLAAGDLYGMAILHEGVTRARDIRVTGGDGGVVQVSGELDASDAAPGATGGRIAVTGDKVALVGARLDASGAAGGGAVRIGGDVRGEGPLRTASRTFVDGDSVVRADATEVGDGGSVVVWGGEAAAFHGTLSARGGAGGGDGGFAEISSEGLLVDEGAIDLTAPAGASGTLLYDPQDIVVVGGTADGSDDPDASDANLETDGGNLGEVLFGDVGDGTDPFEIHESEIEGTDANIVLEARNSITISGAFGGDAVDLVSGNSLTLHTRNLAGDSTGSAMAAGINLGTLVAWRTSGGSDGSIEIATGVGGPGGEAANVTVGDLFTEGGAVDVSAANGGVSTGNIVTVAADAGTASGDVTLSATGGLVSLGATSSVDASGADNGAGAGGAAGNVTVTSDTAVTLDANVDTRGGTGTGGPDGDAGDIRVVVDGAAGILNMSAILQATGGTDGEVVLAADTTNLADLVQAGVVTLTVGTDGRGIELGTELDAARLSITDAELNQISADAIRIGSSSAVDALGIEAGAIEVTSTIDTTNIPALALVSAAGVTDAASGRILADGLRIESAGATLDGLNDIQTLAARMTGEGDSLSFTKELGGFAVGTVDGLSGVATADASADMASATSGSIELGTGGDLTGDATGTISTGDALVTNAGGGDVATSGDVTLTATGAVELAAADALATGDATEAGGGAVTGDIVVMAERVAADGSTATLDVAQGAVSAGGTAGTLEVVTTGGAGEAGGAYLGSGESLVVSSVDATGDVVLAAVGDLVASGAGPHVQTPGNLTLAGADIGSATTLLVAGGDGADDTLVIDADGVVDVDVTELGFGAIAVRQADATSDVDVLQAGGDAIDIDGSAGPDVSTVASVDTTAGGVDFDYVLDDVGAELVVQTGTMNLGGDTVLENLGGDLTVGTAAGTAIVANGNDLTLAASGAIADGAAGAAGAVIDMQGGAGSPGDLLLIAQTGVGADGDRITTQNLGNVAASSPNGGIFLSNTGTGAVTIASLAAQSIGGTDYAASGLDAGSDDVAVTSAATDGDLVLDQDVVGGAVTLETARDLASSGGVVDLQGGALQLVAGRSIGAEGSELGAQGVGDLAAEAGTGGDVHLQVSGADVRVTAVNQHGSTTTGVSADGTAGELELRNTLAAGDLTLVENASGANVTLEADGDLLDGGGSVSAAGDLQLLAGGGVGTGVDALEASGVQGLAVDAGAGVNLEASGADVSITTVNRHGSTTTGVDGGTGDALVDNPGGALTVASPVTATAGTVALSSTGVLSVDDTVDSGVTTRLDTPATLEFGVATLGDGSSTLLLNTLGASVDVDRATVSSDGSLTLDGTDVTVGDTATAGPNRRQRFTVRGTLTVNASGNFAAGDVTAEQIVVNAATAQMVLREGASILQPDGSSAVDGGADWVVDSDNLVLNLGAPMTTLDPDGTGANAILATTSGGAIANAPAGSTFALSGDVELVGFAGPADGVVLDDAAEGVLVEGCVDCVPPVPEEIRIGGGFLNQLNTAAAAQRPLWGSDFVGVIRCSLFEDEDPDLVPAECEEYVAKQKEDPRFQTRPMQAASELYGELYADVDLLLDSLQDAADAYRASAPAGGFSGEGLRRFVERTPDQRAARENLARLQTFFGYLDEAAEAGAGAEDVEAFRQQLLSDITPSGMSPEELREAIEAAPSSARAPVLAASDGLPAALRRAGGRPVSQ